MSGKRLEEQVSSQQPKEVIIHRLLQKVEKNLLQREREREREREAGLKMADVVEGAGAVLTFGTKPQRA